MHVPSPKTVTRGRHINLWLVRFGTIWMSHSDLYPETVGGLENEKRPGEWANKNKRLM